MHGTDLDRPVWFPLLVGGWVPVHAVLASCRLHTWRHVMELRLRHPMRTHCRLPMPRITTLDSAIGYIFSFLCFFILIVGV
jgi:hypothetical protein